MIRGVALLALMGTMILSSCAKKESAGATQAQRGGAEPTAEPRGRRHNLLGPTRSFI